MNDRIGPGQGLALGGGPEIGEDLGIFVEQFLDVVPGQDLDRQDAVFAVRTVEIKQRTLQALGLGGRGSDHEAPDWELQARGPVNSVLDLGERQVVSRSAEVALDGGESRASADLDKVDPFVGAFRVAKALELRKLPMTPQELETESFELVSAPGQRISWGEFCHSVSLPNTMSAAQEAPQTAVAGESHFRHANAADKMPFLPCLVSTTFPSPTGAARSSTG